MELVAKLDEFGKPAWIGLMVLSFIVFWPIGLAILAYLIWSGRMGCWKGSRNWRSEAARFSSGYGRGHWHSSGNRAFDEYREQTLTRLEDEQKEFTDFLAKLRMAKDKAEFDDFMAERRARPEQPKDRPDNVPDTGPREPEGRPQG